MKLHDADTITPIFDGYTFAIVLPTGHSYEQKRLLRHKITSRGGTISYLITKKCHFVILGDVETQKDSLQTRTANKYDIPFIPVHFVDDCIAEGKVVECEKYTSDRDEVTDGHSNENFTKGVIVSTQSESTATIKRTSASQKILKVWQFLDPNGPQFHNDPYQVVKFALLVNKEYGMRKGEVPFCVLEVQVSSKEDSDPRFCIYVNSGSINVQNGDKTKTNRQRDVKKPSIDNCRYCNDATQALDTYSKLHKMYTSPPQSMVKWSTKDTDVDIPSTIGSPQFQKVIQSWLVTRKTPDDNVAELVDHLWIEAVGQLNKVLSVQVGALSTEKIEKADGLLHEIQKRLDSGQSDDDQRLEGDFYDHIPQKYKEPLTNKAALARQFELVQLIRDIVSTSEALGSNEPKDSILARYSALDCFVTHLPHGSEEYDTVSGMVLTSQRATDIRIKNIFSLRRPLEEATFRRDLTNTMLLFHASSFRNFVGILSRGLLLPKMIASDESHGQSNPRSGLYFASGSSTSIKYAIPSGTKKTRLMLVAQVALGNCLQTRIKMDNWKQPPEGFQSIHGIGNTESVPSDFEDDEYIIFRSDQQQLKYLVEFSFPDDNIGCIPKDVHPKIGKAVDIPKVNVTIEDLRDISYKASRTRDVQFGLQSSENLPAFLRSVHVRANLVDLAANVVVLQEYTNKSTIPIEAKYVFPLEEMGAVCGFEAFINGKHIVGKIEEKQQAHQKYKKAITEGHGAYLMDQETPDVFVVSVGNLPPEAEVLIKITYVTELVTEGELINFSIPGSVAPWQKNLAPLEQAMEHFVTVDNSQIKDTSLEISLEMPFEIRRLVSTTHRILVKKTETKATVKLVESEDLDRQFQLLVGLAEIHVPRMWVEQHPEDGTEACMLTFYPTFESSQPESGTVIFLIDCSNSMQNGSFIYAQAITLMCLHHLHVNWSFNIVAFGSTYEELFPVPCQKSPESVKLAEEFILGITSNMGNTRLSSPLQQHFLFSGSVGHVQSVFLISDGHVTDSGHALLEQAAKHYRVCRIFTIGVESDSVPCNRHFMKSLAVRGAGAFELFDHQGRTKWESKVKSQLKKAAQPVLTDVTVEWQQFGSNAREPVQAPKHTVTLFHDARHVVYGFVPNCTVATLHAKVNGKELSTVVSTSDLGKTQGKLLHTLTAKAVIRDWEDGILHKDRMQHEGLKVSMKKSIITMSKTYNILTSITSFVAVEKRDAASGHVSKGPTVMEIVNQESVDQLPYIAYDGEDENHTLPSSKYIKAKGIGYSVNAAKQKRSISHHADSSFIGDLAELSNNESESRIADDKEKEPNVPASAPKCGQSFAFGSAKSPQTLSGLFGAASVAPPAAPRAQTATVPFGSPIPQQSTSPSNRVPAANASCLLRQSESLSETLVTQCSEFRFATPQTNVWTSTTFGKSAVSSQVQSVAFKMPKKTMSQTFFSDPKMFPCLTGGGYGAAPALPPPPPPLPERFSFFKATPELLTTAAHSDSVAPLRCSIPDTFPPPPAYQFQQQMNLSADGEFTHKRGHEDSFDRSEEQNEISDRIQPRKKCVRKRKMSFWESKDKSPVLNTVIDPSLLSATEIGLTKKNYVGGLPLVSFILTIFEHKVPKNVQKLIEIGTQCKTSDFKKTMTEIMKDCSDNDDVTDNEEEEEEDANLTVNGILSLINTEGFIDSNAVNSLLNTVQMNEKLQFAGIKSLGDAASAIINMCLTVAMILCVTNTFLTLDDNKRPHTKADLGAAENMLIKSITPQNRTRFLCALLYVTYVDRRYPMVYNTLQLENNWESFVASFLYNNNQE